MKPPRGKPPGIAQLKAARAKRAQAPVPEDRAPGSFPIVRLDDAEIERRIMLDRMRGLLIRRRLDAAWPRLDLWWLPAAWPALVSWRRWLRLPEVAASARPPPGGGEDLPLPAAVSRAAVAACPRT